jgi:hypothetical protein
VFSAAGLGSTGDDQRARRRYALDPRVTFVHRTEAQRTAVGSGALIRFGFDAQPPPAPGARLRVAFPGDPEWLARTAWLLARESAIEWLTPAAATAIPGIATRRGDEVDVAVLVHGSVREALSWSARGALVLTTPTAEAAEVLASEARLAPDPGAIAAELLVLLDPQMRAKRLAEQPAPRTRAQQATEELALLSPPAARVTAMGAPLLTVVVPAWNAERHLERCVRSLTRGAATDLEVLIVNDGSTDGTRVLAEHLAGPGVRVVHQENRGHGGAINTGLAEAHGTWFRVVDADDWVDPPAFASLLEALRVERRADLVLTDYAEVRPESALPKRAPLFERLPVGGLCTFEGLTHERWGLSSWGPILSTSTFRTELLRKAGLRLTEHSSYVDLEYCTLGLEYVETMRPLDLDLYRYSLGSDSQSVSQESYRRRYQQHEAVIARLCEFVAKGTLSAPKRTYVIERVIAPVVRGHAVVLRTVLRDPTEEEAFRRRMGRFDFVNVPPATPREQVKGLLEATLHPGVVKWLTRALRTVKR